MIFVALLFTAIGIGIGYYWGKDVGSSHLERKIVNHVVNSPNYSDELVRIIKKSLRTVKQ